MEEILINNISSFFVLIIIDNTMNNILIALIICVLAGLGTVIGSLLVFIPNIGKSKYISLILAFSGSIMILISILDLLPTSIDNILNNYSVFKGLIIILSSFIIGALLIGAIDKRIEEGSSLFKVGILSMIGLMIHNFPEGIATFMTSLYDTNLGIKLSIAIMLHNIPEGICIAIPIAKHTHSTWKGVGASFLSSLAEPLGALCAYLFLMNFINEITISIILIFVAGIMINLSINNIYKESLKLDQFKYFILGIILSFIYIFITLKI